MEQKVLGQIVVFLFLIQVAMGALNYDEKSYTTLEQVKIGENIVENPYSYSQSDSYLEQRASATVSRSVVEYPSMTLTHLSCVASGYWEDENPDPPYIGETVDARASLTLEFQPHGYELYIYGTGGIYEPPTGALYYYQLTDTDTDDVIPNPYGGPYPINPDHTYVLDMYAGTTLYDPYLNGAQVEVNFWITPEPTTLLLLGLGGLMLRRRKATL